MTIKNFDSCTSFLLEDGAFLGRFVRLDKTINKIFEKHQSPEQINYVLADFTALSTLLSSSMKFEGLFTLQTQTDGPIPMVVIDVSSDGKIRAYSKYDMERINKSKGLRKTTGKIEDTPYMLGSGHLAFSIDQGKDSQLYQGVVEIKGKNLAEIAMRYFKQSEQIETHIKLFVKPPTKKGEKWQSAGIMLQKIASTGGKNKPDIDIEKTWEDIKIFADSLRDTEVFNNKLSQEKLINRLYHSNKLLISNTKSYDFACRCSRNKLLDTLSTFKSEDIESMLENNQIIVNCNFCSENYVFEKGELLKH